MLEGAAGVAFGVDVADLLDLERTLEGNGVGGALAEDEHVLHDLAAGPHREELVRDLLDRLAHALQGHAHVGGQAVKRFDHHWEYTIGTRRQWSSAGWERRKKEKNKESEAVVFGTSPLLLVLRSVDLREPDRHEGEDGDLAREGLGGRHGVLPAGVEVNTAGRVTRDLRAHLHAARNSIVRVGATRGGGGEQ